MEAAQNDLPFSIEYRFVNEKGKVTFVIGQAVSEKDAEGNILGFVGTTTDITARKEAEARIQQSEERFRLASDAARAMVYDVDYQAPGEVLAVYGCAALLGAEPPVPLTRAWYATQIHPDDLPLVKETVARAADGAEYVVQYRLRHADGHYLHVEDHGRMLLDAAGHVVRGIGTVQDITARKQSEELTRQAVERAEVAQEAAQATLYEYRPQTNEVFRSQALQRVLGYTPEELTATAEGWRGLIHPDDARAMWAGVREAFAGKPELTLEYRVRHQDGHYLWMFDRARIVRDAQGAIERVVGMVVDITTRKETEAALAAQKRLYQSVTDNATTALFIMDERQQCAFMNPSAEQLTGYRFAETQGRALHDVVHHTHPDGTPYPLAECPIDQAFPTCDQMQGEEVFVHKDGHFYDVAFTASPLLNDDGQPVGTVIEVQDITARKEAEARLQASRETFRHLVENSPFGIYVVDADFRLTQVSVGAQKVFANVRPLLGRDFAEVLRVIWPEPFASEAINIFRHTLATGEPYHAPSTVEQRHDIDAVESYDWKTERITLPDGRYGVVCHFYDLTERQRYEAALRESEERLQLALASANAGIHVWEIATNTLHWDDRLRELWSIGSEDAVTYELFAQGVHPDDRAHAQAALDRALDPNGDGQYAAEYRVIGQRDGVTRWVAATGQVFFDQQTPLRLVGTARDITERKHRELNLAFLTAWQTEIASLNTSADIARVTAERIAAHFNLTHCLLVEIDETAETATVFHDARATDAPNLAGAYRLAEFHTAEERATLAAGRCVVIHDVRDGARPESAAAGFEALGIRALVTAPFVSYGRWQFALSAQRHTPHIWRDDECALLTELAERVYFRLERVRAEAALRESEHRFRLMADSTPVMIWVTNANGEIEFVNRAYQEYFGVTEAQVLGPNGWQPLVHPDDYATYVQTFLDCLQTRTPFIGECRVRQASGAWRWILSHGAPRFSASGAFLGQAGSSFDISERKEAEAQLQLAILRYELAEEAAQGFNYDWDLPTGHVTRSASMKSVMGYAPDEMPPTWQAWYDLVHPDDLRVHSEAEAHAFVRQMAEDGFSGEYRVRRRDGEYLWVLERAMVLRDEAGRLSRVIGQTVNIQARKQLEIEREQMLAREQEARELAEQANRAKDDWLAMVTHELRSPLNAILGYARLLDMRRTQLTPELAKFAEMVRRNGERQNELINDLLDVARMATGKLQLEPGPVQLAAIVREATETVQASVQAKEIQLWLELEDDLGVITGDAARLQQVVWNLLTNAVKFTPSGGSVMLALHREPEEVVLRVNDTGKGIAPDFLRHVFERFSQADMSRSRRHGGLGLGLALVKQIVELHGGTITAESEGEGQGATFTVRLPAPRKEPPLDAKPKPSHAEPTDLTAPVDLPAAPHEVEVLLIEDEADMRDLLLTLLHEQGVRAQGVKSAAEAWPWLTASQRPHLMICDIALPEEDGYSLLARLRQWEKTHDVEAVPALALTALGSKRDRMQSLRVGFQMHLTKPVDIEELLFVVQSLLARNRTNRT